MTFIWEILPASDRPLIVLVTVTGVGQEPRTTRYDPASEELVVSIPIIEGPLSTPESYHQVKKLVSELDLNTVCQEARCPNIYECWGEHGTATFMILGDICTRRCGFCAVTSGRRLGS